MDEFDLDAMVDQCLGVASTSGASPDRYSGTGSASQRRERPLQRGGPTPSPQQKSGHPDMPYRQRLNDTYDASQQFAADQNFRSPGAVELHSAGHLTGRSYESPSDQGRTDPTLRRIQLWAERREAKRAMLVYEHLQEEMKDCTFHPVRETTQSDRSSQLSPNALYKDNRAWGFDEFVDRLVTARNEREQKQQEDERRMSGATGNNWTPGFTVPEPFEFKRLNRRPIPSLKNHYDTIAPVLREEHDNAMSTIEAPSIPAGLFSVRPSRVIMEHVASPDR